jgi:S-adenosylmethionine decarboxylase
MKSLGHHVIIDMFGCDPNNLNNTQFIINAALNASKSARAKILGKIVHEYSPQGISVAILLAESHLFIHTWPEYGYLACDIFTCGVNTNPEEGVRKLVKILKPLSFDKWTFKRGLLAKVRPLREVKNKRDFQKITARTWTELEKENLLLKEEIDKLKSITRRRLIIDKYPDKLHVI